MASARSLLAAAAISLAFRSVAVLELSLAFEREESPRIGIAKPGT
jgi:hypothetical protein